MLIEATTVPSQTKSPNGNQKRAATGRDALGRLVQRRSAEVCEFQGLRLKGLGFRGYKGFRVGLIAFHTPTLTMLVLRSTHACQL